MSEDKKITVNGDWMKPVRVQVVHELGLFETLMLAAVITAWLLRSFGA